MISKRILAVVGAVALTGSLAAGPAQAASDSGARHKKHSHVGLGITKDPTYGWDVQTSLRVAGKPAAGRVLIIQSKHNGTWRKVRGGAIRTDANGFAAYPTSASNGYAGICVHKVYGRAYNPLLRIHYAGTKRIAEGNSRHFHAPCR